MVARRGHSRQKRAATGRPERIWDHAVIPYEIQSNFSGTWLSFLLYIYWSILVLHAIIIKLFFITSQNDLELTFLRCWTNVCLCLMSRVRCENYLALSFVVVDNYYFVVYA